ncbi:MAG: hypothetical protein ACYC2Y_01060 [Armatimonadota bacterium]
MKRLQMQIAVRENASGPAWVWIAAGRATTVEKATGDRTYLHLLGVLRALELGRNLRVESISVFCPDEAAARIANRELPLPAGSPLGPIYIRIRAMMHTYRRAELHAGKMRARKRPVCASLFAE